MWSVFARCAVLSVVCIFSRRVSATHDDAVGLSREAILPGPALPAPCFERLGESVWAQGPAKRDWMPRCDDYGEFEPVQCTTGSTESGHRRCFCVDLSGDEVTGTSITPASTEDEMSLNCPHSNERTRVCGLAVQRHGFATHHPRPPACLERGSEAHRAWTIVQEQCVGLQGNPEVLLFGGKNLNRDECRAVFCPATAFGAVSACIGALEMWKQALENCNPDSNFMGTLQIAEAWTLACQKEAKVDNYLDAVVTVEIGSGARELPTDGNDCGVRKTLTALNAIDESCCSSSGVDITHDAHGLSSDAINICTKGMPETCAPAAESASGSRCAEVVVPFFEMCGNQLDPVAYESIRILSGLCSPDNGGAVLPDNSGDGFEGSTMSGNGHARESGSVRFDPVAQVLGVLLIIALAAAGIATARLQRTASGDSTTIVVNGLYERSDVESECPKSMMRGVRGDSWVDDVVSAYDLGRNIDPSSGDDAGADDNGSQTAQSRQ